MQRIRYAGTDYFADDRMVEAVLHYAKALAIRRTVELVEVRVGHHDGSVGQARLLIGAGIPIASDSILNDAPSFNGQLVDSEHELRLRRLADRLTQGPDYRPTSIDNPGPLVDLWF